MKRRILYTGVACMMMAALASCNKNKGEDMVEPVTPVVEKELEGLAVKITDDKFAVQEIQYRFEYDQQDRLKKVLRLNEQGGYDLAEDFVWEENKILHRFNGKSYTMELKQGKIVRVSSADEKEVCLNTFDEQGQLLTTKLSQKVDDLTGLIDYTTNTEYRWENGLLRFSVDRYGLSDALSSQKESLLFYDSAVKLPHPFPVFLPVESSNSMLTLIHPELYGYNTEYPLVEIESQASDIMPSQTFYANEYDTDGYLIRTIGRTTSVEMIKQVEMNFTWR